mmetsp:Transcript_79225/g.256828  ORF Transcript_79225/g.256828 Transcript_79225/m.256828 type:complete len:201 (-) Transcript_79225:940-1542(-)
MWEGYCPPGIGYWLTPASSLLLPAQNFFQSMAISTQPAQQQPPRMARTAKCTTLDFLASKPGSAAAAAADDEALDMRRVMPTKRTCGCPAVAVEFPTTEAFPVALSADVALLGTQRLAAVKPSPTREVKMIVNGPVTFDNTNSDVMMSSRAKSTVGEIWVVHSEAGLCSRRHCAQLWYCLPAAMQVWLQVFIQACSRWYA